MYPHLLHFAMIQGNTGIYMYYSLLSSQDPVVWLNSLSQILPLSYLSLAALSAAAAAAAAAKSLQLCPTLCDPTDGSPPGSPVPGILQARTLEWIAISFSNAWKWKVKVKSFSRVQPSATPWTAAFQAPPSMGFSRQEYWSGLPLPSPDSKLYRPCGEGKVDKWISLVRCEN